MDALTLVSFLSATLGVAVITKIWVRRLAVSRSATEEYFTGGRSLAWPVVAGSLLLTNLSTEQLVGLNGAVFGDANLAGVAWEALAALAMIVTAAVFLPRYLRSGFTTTPAFLEQRFHASTRTVVSAFFLAGYVTVLLPVVLYTGSLALRGMFDLEIPLWLIVVGIGVLGSWYAIFGGLKSVAISDTLNGIGLLIGGLAVPLLGLAAIGDGSVFDGVTRLASEQPERLAVLGDDHHSVPWHTLLTGMMVIQVFYWSTNQVIVQRAMGAKSLAGGQKGLLFAAAMKIMGPVMLCLPGIIALHMSDLGIEANDQVYPAVVRRVLPDWSLGLFAAVLVGSILSSFNSSLNSASTLFSLEFYRRYIRPDATDEATVTVGKRFGTVIAITAMGIAPLLAHAESIFEYLQKINGLYSVPVITVFILGIATRWASARGANVGMAVGLACYAFFTFVGVEGLHWLHGYGISFAVAVVTVIAVSAVAPCPGLDEKPALPPPRINMTPWSGLKPVVAAIVGAVLFLYLGLTLAATGCGSTSPAALRPGGSERPATKLGNTEARQALLVFRDVLDLHGVPAQAHDRRLSVMFDLGSWQGWGTGAGDKLGFSGPWLLGDNRYVSPRLLTLDVGVPLTSPVERYAIPGSLHQRVGVEGGELELELRWLDHRSVGLEIRCDVPLPNWQLQGTLFDGAGDVRRLGDGFVVDLDGGAYLVLYPLANARALEGPAFGFHATENKGEHPVQLLVGYALDHTDRELLYPASNRSGRQRAFDSAFAQGDQRWQTWIERATTQVNGQPIPSERSRRLAVKALWTLVGNWRAPYGSLLRDGLFPSYHYSGFHGFWSWDSWKHAVGLADVIPRLAAHQIETLYAHQRGDGMIPDVVYRDGYETNWRDTKPPLSAWAVRAVYSATEDTAWLRIMLPRVEAYHRWWTKDRDHDSDGLWEFGSTDGTRRAAKWESGMDNAVRFDGVKMVKNGPGAWSMDQESVDLSAYMAYEKKILAELWSAVGDEVRARRYRSQYDETAAKIRERFFNPDTGWFHDRKLDGRWVNARGPEGWTPLFVGVASPEQAARVRETMLEETRFATAAPFPTLDASHPAFQPVDGYWRGPIWLDQAYFGLRALRRYGYHDDADQLLGRLLASLEGLHTDQPIRETYNPRTGKGQNAHHFSWSAASLLMMLRGAGTGD